MTRRSVVPTAGRRKSVPLRFPPELAVSLQAFCEVHFRASQNEVIARAVERFIREELRRDPQLEAEFESVRERLMLAMAPVSKASKAESIRLVHPTPQDPTSGGQ